MFHDCGWDNVARLFDISVWGVGQMFFNESYLLQEHLNAELLVGFATVGRIW